MSGDKGGAACLARNAHRLLSIASSDPDTIQHCTLGKVGDDEAIGGSVEDTLEESENGDSDSGSGRLVDSDYLNEDEDEQGGAGQGKSQAKGKGRGGGRSKGKGQGKGRGGCRGQGPQSQRSSAVSADFLQRTKREISSLQQALVNAEQGLDVGQRVLFSGGGPDEIRDVFATHIKADQGRVISFCLSQQNELTVFASAGADMQHVKEQESELKEFIFKVLPRLTPGGGSASSSSQAVVFRDGKNHPEELAMSVPAAFKLVGGFLKKELGPLLDAAEPFLHTSAAGRGADALESVAVEPLRALTGGPQIPHPRPLNMHPPTRLRRLPSYS